MANVDHFESNPFIGRWRVVAWRVRCGDGWTPHARYGDADVVWEFPDRRVWVEVRGGRREKNAWYYDGADGLLSLERDVMSPDGRRVDAIDCDRFRVGFLDGGRRALLYSPEDYDAVPDNDAWHAELARMG